MRKAFTLIELLVVISIIALLIAILLPVLSSVRYESTNFLCVNRQRQWVIATTAYCTDNDGFYPDRGIDNNTAGERHWARRAARMWNQKNVDDNLDVVLGQYMADEIAVWVCPLYKGSYYGTEAQGKSIRFNNDNIDRWTTYAFHGGLSEGRRANGTLYANAGGHLYNPGNRRGLDDRYVIELADGTRYESNLLMSDTASGDNSWVPAVYPSAPTGLFDTAPFAGITTNHQPPASSQTQVLRDPEHGLVAVADKVYYNFANDDGSAETRTVTAEQGMNSDEWTPVRDGRRYMLFPN